MQQEEPNPRHESCYDKESVQDEMKETVSSLYEATKDKTEEATEELKQKGRNFITDSKLKLIREITTCEESIRNAAQTLREDNDDALADLVETCAVKLNQAGSYIAKHNIQEIYEDANYAASKNPKFVIGGLFLAGLAATRFLKASNPNPDIPEKERTE